MSKRKKEMYTSPLQKNLKKLYTNKLAMVGLIIIFVILFMSIFAPLLTPYIPNGVDIPAKLMNPSMTHIFGTDKLGRDVFTRILYGGRVSILISLVSSLVGGAIGVILGAVSGYTNNKFDKIMLRVSEVFMSFPQILLVLLLSAIAGPGVINLFVVFILTGWMGTFRLVRGRFLGLREENYVDACRAFGVGNGAIIFSHILPNTLGPVIVSITGNVANYILSESGLSFLGLGVPSSVVTWGNIINVAKEVATVKNYPWLWIPVGLTISLFVLAINFFGDGLRDIYDPSYR